MKKTLLLAALALLTFGAQAQMLKAAQVPAVVKATFKAQYPTVTTNTWEKEHGNYEAAFTMKGATMSALINPAGELVEKETDMAATRLPAAVRATLARDYKTYKVTEAATIVSATGATTYEAELSKAGKKHDVLFNENGTLAKK
ncbi:PepSY-like domain-containing protein [Hymenobacter sp. PAMC 26628]|uniref:PepSY-like domain-containing protein n=1 Tax=Hymenobacter sp. PAMC 26628 TaxID=1484118 RepID=UPI0007704565|nr:PepSY-like domain-containing protein [Hymenobacter sp. PAMC 26628]AMJ65980.1 hypothetical protein AXW84_11460 [Hymenobacter sp. PAMC 26628]